MKKRMLFLALAAWSIACEPVAPVPDPAEERNLLEAVQTIRADMSSPSDAWPHGVPVSFGWGGSGRVGWGNNPPADWSAIIPWGQVYVSADSAHIPANTKVQLRNLGVWIYSQSQGQWVKAGGSVGVEGAHYVEDFAGDVNQPATSLRGEPDGGISVAMIPGHNFHFWSQDGRQTMNPADIGAVVVSCEARLIVNNPGQPDDRPDAFWMLSVGADYWKDKTAAWDNFRTNGDVAISRFRKLGPDWQTVYMHTATEAQLRAYVEFLNKN